MFKVIKTLEFDNGMFWDFVKTIQGYAIQRNGRTVWGRLSAIGGREIWEDEMNKYSKKHKIVSDRDNNFDNVGRHNGWE